jgi:AcrR family transcriptional regulator
MIADRTGITKAGIYHHYKTKDGIIVAAAEQELARMEGTIDAAESETTWPEARQALLSNMVDLAVERRRLAGTLLNDPVIARVIPENESFGRVMQRMNRMLMGTDTGPDAHLRTAMLIAAISGTAIHPFAMELDDDVLRSQLLELARRLLDQPAELSGTT